MYTIMVSKSKKKYVPVGKKRGYSSKSDVKRALASLQKRTQDSSALRFKVVAR